MTDKEALENLQEAAPYSWRCSSLYYQIAEKYGVSANSWDPDFIRDAVIDKILAS